MKWMILLLPLFLAACYSFNDPDEVAYKEVVVPAPNPRVNLWGDQPKLDVTCPVIHYY